MAWQLAGAPSFGSDGANVHGRSRTFDQTRARHAVWKSRSSSSMRSTSSGIWRPPSSARRTEGSMASKRYDLVILGSGSTAFAAALRAQELGKTAVMTEERTLGGTCVNRGCLPSKNLIEAAKTVHDARNPRYPGLRGADLGLDFARLIAQKDEIVESYRGKKYESLVGG